MIEKFGQIIRINEVYPNPDTDENNDGTVDQNDEFVELFNPGMDPVDINGFSISDNVGTYVIPSGSIPSQGWFLVWRETSGLKMGSPDRIELRDANESVIDLLSWDTVSRGRSIQRSPDGAERTRSVKDHSPGDENLPPLEVLINEIMIDPEGANTGNQWIELYNPGHEEDIEDLTIENGDGISFQIPELRMRSDGRCVILTGKPDIEPDLGNCTICSIDLGRAFFVNGDNICLLDPDGYLLDFVAWGSSSHVDPPSGTFTGSPWDGELYDALNGTMSGDGETNPVLEEGISLKRSFDAQDTNSTTDFILDRGSRGHTMGYDNSLDPGIEIEGSDTVLYVPGGEWIEIQLNITNTGSMDDDLNIDVQLTSDSWDMEGPITNMTHLGPGEVLPLRIRLKGPSDLTDNRTCSVILTMNWSSIPFLDLGKELKVIVPGPDLKVQDLSLDMEGENQFSIPEGIIGTVSFSVEGGGEVHPGNTSVTASIIDERTNSTLILFEEELENMRTGSRRSFEIGLDTLGLAGNHTLSVIVDPENLIDEIDEDNNIAGIYLSILPSSIPPGQEGVKITSVLWNCSEGSTFVEIMNPGPLSVLLDGMKLSDGEKFVSFESHTPLGTNESAYLVWGAKALERIPKGARAIWVQSGGGNDEKMTDENGIPDPFDTGRIELLSRYRHPVDRVLLKEMDEICIETTWGSILFRSMNSQGQPVDTNSSFDWRVREVHAWIGGFLPSPGPEGSGEIIVLRTDHGNTDVSGLALFSRNRCAVIPNGTLTDPNGILTIGSDPIRFHEIQIEGPDLCFGYDPGEIDGTTIAGCRIPSYQQMLLPNDGGSIILVDPGNNGLDRLDWGAVEEPQIKYTERDVLYWKDSMEENWRVLSFGSQKIRSISSTEESTPADLFRFDGPEELMDWILEEDHITIVAEVISSDSIYTMSAMALDSGKDLDIVYHIPPWEKLDAKWELIAGTDLRTSMAIGLWKKGADIWFSDDRREPGGMTLAYSKKRLAMFPGPIMETRGDTGIPFIGLEFQVEDDEIGPIQHLISSVLTAEIIKADSHLELIEVEPRNFSTITKYQNRGNTSSSICKVRSNDWLSLDVLKGNASYIPGNGPLDLVEVLEMLQDDPGIDIMLNPRELRVYSRNAQVLIDEVMSRVGSGDHLHWTNGLVEDVLLRTSVVNEILRSVHNSEKIGVGDPALSIVSFGGYGTSDELTSVWLPSFRENSMGIRIDIETGFPVDLGPLFNKSSKFPRNLLPSDGNGSKVGGRHDLRLEEVYYDTYLVDDPDEYITLKNTGDDPVDLSGFMITDDEGLDISSDGIIVLGDTSLQPGELYFITIDGERFLDQNGFMSDTSWKELKTSIPVHGLVRLSNSNDTVCLRDPVGNVVDVVVYGSANWDSGGWNHYGPVDWKGDPAEDVGWGKVMIRTQSSGSLPDTDTAVDWSGPRPRYPGQSRFSSFPRREVSNIFYGVCPDSSSEILDDIISQAGSTLLVNVYEMTSHWITSRLIGAVDRGVQVKVILEGNPVGGISIMERSAVSRLVEKGIPVHFMVSDPKNGIRDRYRYNHAKYVVADNKSTFVSTDNFKDSSFPPLTAGSMSTTRGWVVSMRSKDISKDMASVFFEDWSGPDIKVGSTMMEQWGDDLETRFFDTVSMHIDLFGPGRSEDPGFSTIIVSPDHISMDDNDMMKAIQGAESEILLELMDIGPFYLDNGLERTFDLEGISNPYLLSLLDAAKRGANVKILLDGSDFNGDQIPDNKWKLDMIMGAAEEMDIQDNFRMELNPITRHHETGDICLVHAKGMIVDSRKVWISSYNWNPTSGMENREVGMMVSSGECASYFRDVFHFDWNGTLQDDVKARKIWAFGEETGNDRVIVEGEFEIDVRGSTPMEFRLYMENQRTGELTCLDESGQIAPGTSLIRLKGGYEHTDDETTFHLTVVHDDRELNIMGFTLLEQEDNKEDKERGIFSSPLTPLFLIPIISLGIVISFDLVRMLGKKRKNGGPEE
ncbi:MAG: lamin tail domain-containing protein [Candidatus Thermoplasmatota archaeon]|nr:lamin tail domain-containing protein [Candidatus Thermoplasmatota archaeon]